MKAKFGKRNTDDGVTGNGHSALSNILAFAVIVLVVVFLIAFIRGTADFAPLAMMGMLGDPFRTTRKMNVPFKSRMGHRERSFRGFVKIAWGLGIALLILYFIAQVIELFKAV